MIRKFSKKRLTGAGSAENHGVRDILVMQVQKVGRVMAGFEHREIFLAEMGVARFARMQREEERNSPHSWY